MKNYGSQLIATASWGPAPRAAPSISPAWRLGQSINPFMRYSRTPHGGGAECGLGTTPQAHDLAGSQPRTRSTL
jgi:hypothetical protein